MKVILEFDGTPDNFEKAFDAIDDQFDIHDNVFYQIDNEERNTTGIHHTDYGDILITVME